MIEASIAKNCEYQTHVIDGIMGNEEAYPNQLALRHESPLTWALQS